MKTRTWIVTVLLLLLMVTCGVNAERIIIGSPQGTDGFKASETATPGINTKNMTVPGVNMSTLAARIVGTGITYSNVSYKGVNWSAGFFNNGSSVIGISQGILLSTGDIQNVVGPNNYQAIENLTGTAGDLDLDKLISPYSTWDATVLEFDFIPNKTVIQIQYVFSSDEYNEYVGSPYNDVFGFFVNGNNIAKLPDTSNVSINDINSISHADYYRNNSIYPVPPYGPINTEMDGLTTVITSMVSVTPNTLNHMKIAIADAGDRRIDSNVFIKDASISTYTGPVVYSLRPASANLGAVNKTIRVIGDNFNRSSNISLTRGAKALKITSKRYITPTRMAFNVTIPWTSPAGKWNLTVKNPDGRVYRAVGIFALKNPVPVLTTISPTSRLHGGLGFTLNVTGNNFVPTSRVRWNNAGRTSSYISRTKMSATITAADILSPGIAKVTVFNAPPAGGISNSKNFTKI